jgi:hypothetical protein
MCCSSAQCLCPRKRPLSTAWFGPAPRFDTCGFSPSFSAISPVSYWNSLVTSCRCDMQQTAGAKVVQKPFVNYRDDLAGNISKVSVGETSGLFPTDSGAANKLYRPSEWNPALTQQLLECRAAVTLIATRGERHHAVVPKTGTALERTLAAYHLKDNFPVVSSEILNDPTVKFFYLSPDKNAVHTGLDYKTWDIRLVKSYGPFYNVGGGDVPRGLTYVNFYSGRRKSFSPKK